MGFSLFGPYHIGWLIIITITVILFSQHFKNLDARKQKALQKKIAWSIVLLELSKTSHLIIRDEYSINYLPLELCSFAIFAIFYHAYTDNVLIGEMLYNLFLPGAIAALLFCNWTHRPVYEFLSLFSFIFHFLLVTYSVIVVYAGIVKPHIKRIISSILFLTVSVPTIFQLNKIWDTNFMFLNVPSPGSPLEPLEQIFGNPGYIFGLVCILITLWSVMYLPWNKLRKVKQMKVKFFPKYDL